MAKKNPLTSDILIETLKRSSLKTVLIEGKDDLQIYRHIEDELDYLEVDFLPCDGRANLLEVYKSKEEIKTKLLFICDSDMWLFVPKPTFLKEHIIITEGYSIENELYQDGSEILNKLFSDEEIIKKNTIIANLCIWFAYEVSLVINNSSHDCKFSDVSILNHEIIKPKSCEFEEDFLKLRNFSAPKAELMSDIINNYKIKLRGKFIFQTLEKIFQERSKKLTGYRKDQLFDLIYRTVTKTNDPTKILNNRKQKIIEHFQSVE